MGLREIAHGAKSIAQTTVGQHRASLPIFKARIVTCAACPNAGKKLGVVDQCTICGCFIRYKAADAREWCPLGYWPE